MEKRWLVGIGAIGSLLISAPVFSFLEKFGHAQPLVYYIFCCISLTIGIGILLLKEWARKSAIVFTALLTILFLVTLVISFEKFGWLFYYLFIGYFFTLPKVEEQFG